MRAVLQRVSSAHVDVLSDAMTHPSAAFGKEQESGEEETENRPQEKNAQKKNAGEATPLTVTDLL